MRQKLSFLLSLAGTDIALTSLQCKITSFQAAEEKGHKTTKSGQNCSLARPVISVVKTKKSCPAPHQCKVSRQSTLGLTSLLASPGPQAQAQVAADDDYNLTFFTGDYVMCYVHCRVLLSVYRVLLLMITAH